MKAPEILLSGHHAQIAQWRAKQALERTAARRPDLLDESAQEKAAKSKENQNL